MSNDQLDDALLAELRTTLDRFEPVDPDSTTLARAALGWRLLDVELALLVHDSAVDDAELVVRSDDDRRILSFENDRVRIDVEHHGGQIVGQILPMQPAVVEVYRVDGTLASSTTVDEFGAFTVPSLPTGPVAFGG